MKCEIMRNGQIIAGAMDYDATKVREIVTQNGGDFRLVPARLSSAVKIGTLAIKPVREEKPAKSRMESYTAPTRTEEVDRVVYTYGTQPRSAQSVRDELKRDLAKIHDRYDNGRLVHRDVSIKADLEARINVSGTLDEFKKGTVTSTNWRGREVLEATDDLLEMDGGNRLGGVAKIPVTSEAEMQDLYDAIFGYLSAGFAAKETIEAEIDALSEADLATYQVKKAFDAAAGV
jgi:hypothetical protein